MGGIKISKLISIIIPVYNKELFIDKCVQSLIDLDIDKNQIEAIFIDDLSSDNSFRIIENYAQKYEFIKCIQLSQNSGDPSTPRNIGIQNAKGEFITLLDADDWLDPIGLPKLVKQMIQHNSDIGFGQCFKHTDNNIKKIATFASYQIANGLIPYEIPKIFRAVGPPGKVFKKSTVVDNNIQFKKMKFGEDKLFFAELISKSKSASMSSHATYHVNRYSENVSLVKSTTVIEKSEINLKVLECVLQLNITDLAKKHVLSRIIEMDFMSRFLVTKTFLKSDNKEYFYNQFSKMENIISEAGYDVKSLLTIDKYKNLYQLFHSNRTLVKEYVHYLLFDLNKNKFIKNNVVHYETKENFIDLIPLYSICTPVYSGTKMIDNHLYESIKLFKNPKIKINDVKLVEINNATQSTHIDYKILDDYIYIKTSDLTFGEKDFNIEVQFNDYNSELVFATYPNHNSIVELKRENFKLEFNNPKNKNFESNSTKTKYISKNPKQVLITKNIKKYSDTDFKIAQTSIKKGTLINIIGIDHSTKGTPRLITDDQYFITANTDFVSPSININKEGYICETPKKIKVLKKCKLYHDVSFKNDHLGTLKPGDEINIIDIAFTKNLTPRLKTQDGYFITANKKFIEVLS